jgi:hypothetical protein
VSALRRSRLSALALGIGSLAVVALAVIGGSDAALGAPDAGAPKGKPAAAAKDAGAKDKDAGPKDAGPKDQDAAAAPDAGADTDAGASENEDDSNDAGAPASEDAGTVADGGTVIVSCTEHIPPGATRPDLVEVLPERGLSGYAVNLVVIVGHGKGETVLPEGFHVRTDSDTGHALEVAGFAVPDQDGGSPASIVREEKANGATTKITIPIVPLPPEAGRNEMVVPSLPIAVQRASNQIVTLCTRPQRIRIEDPTANEDDPKVRPNPPPRSQREEWTLAKQVSIGVLIGATLAAIGAWLYLAWKRRPKPVKVVPKKLPWIQAFEELAEIRESDLLEQGKNDIYYERVSNTVRKYLGARYGFDGLERTTDEMTSILRRIKPVIEGFAEIIRFLEDSDLVKFARFTPSDGDCRAALARGQSIVHMTMPPFATTASADEKKGDA